MTHWLFRNMLCNFQTFGNFPGFFLALIFLILLWLKNSSILYYNWRIITLQYCDGFCHALTWIGHRYTCVPLSWTCLPPPSTPSAQVVTKHWHWVPCFMHWTWTGLPFYSILFDVLRFISWFNLSCMLKNMPLRRICILCWVVCRAGWECLSSLLYPCWFSF